MSARVDEQPAQQQLREDERGHELDGLELGARERAQQQAQRHAEQGVGHRQHATSHAPCAASRPRKTNPTTHTITPGRRPAIAERDRVAGQQSSRAIGQRHQPLERARRALAEHRDRGDQEHHDEREQAAHRGADLLEHPGLARRTGTGSAPAARPAPRCSRAIVRGSRRICHRTRDRGGPRDARAHAPRALDHGEEGPREVLLAGLLAQPLRRRHLEDSPLAHQHQPVALGRLVHLVARDEQRRPPRRPARGRPARARRAAPGRGRPWARRAPGARGAPAGPWRATPVTARRPTSIPRPAPRARSGRRCR